MDLENDPAFPLHRRGKIEVRPTVRIRDGVDLALAQGVTAIAQPGGSIRDFEVVQAVNQASPQVAMVFTGQRSFKH